MADKKPLPTSDPLINRYFLSPQERSKKENGKAIVKAFYALNSSADGLAFFNQRSARWIELYLWAKGSQRMNEFLDYMSIQDATKAWVNIDTTPQRVAAQFVGTLVRSMSKNSIYPCVSAIDDGSVNEKESRLLDALFRMNEVETIAALQEQSGVMVEPPTAFVPDDEVSAKVYYELEDRLPKEIKFEEFLAMVQKRVHFERVLNPKTISDLTIVNFAATKIERCGEEYTVRKCVPPNTIYNFFLNDSSELEVSMIGEFWNMKVRDFRKKFLKSEENPEGLTEKDIYELAKQSTNKALGTFNYNWQDQWGQSSYYANRPYDDCNILVLDCEINCGEDVYFVTEKDPFDKEVISEKKGIPYQQRKKDGTVIEQEKPDGVEVIKRNQNSWMRGVYAPYGDKMLYWGRPDLIVPRYTDTSRPLSSYTVNIPNNDGDYVPSLFERGIEILREYSLTKLKRKQLIAQLTRTGYKIDVETARNVDLGNGNTLDWEEVVRIKNQTGIEVWSSKGIDPLKQERAPISQGTPDDTIQKILGLSEVMRGQIMELREVWGAPPYRDGADVGDRTSGTLQEGQQQASFNVTDFIANANMQLWEETFYKLCLLKWNDIVKEEPESKSDMLDSRFDVKVKMRMTDYERERLENDIARFSQMPDALGNPLISPKDALMLRNIENYTLAMWYLDSTVKKNRKMAQEESARLQQQNAEVQVKSIEAKAKADKDLLTQDKIFQQDLDDRKADKQKEIELIKGLLAAAAKDESGTLIQQFMPALQQLVPNIALGLEQDTNKKIQEQEAQAAAEEQQAMEAAQGVDQMAADPAMAV